MFTAKIISHNYNYVQGDGILNNGKKLALSATHFSEDFILVMTFGD